MARVLVLDEQNAGVGLRALLGARGHSVEISEKLNVLESLAQHAPPDLLFVEPYLARRDAQALERIRAIMSSTMQRGHVVVCTDIFTRNELSETYGLQEGAHYHEYFIKPVDPADMLEQIQFKTD